LLRIAKNLCIDQLRKKRPELMEELPEAASDETPLDLLEGAIEMDRLEKAIDKLPANQRSAVLLRHGEQLSYRRVAEVMDLSVGAVESLLVRARRTLRRNLGAAGE
jgi:RNA polymerase sigma-70 factor (ECF subfamily)